MTCYVLHVMYDMLSAMCDMTHVLRVISYIDMLGVKCYVTCCVITVMCEVLYVMYPNDSNTVHAIYTNTHTLIDRIRCAARINLRSKCSD